MWKSRKTFVQDGLNLQSRNLKLAAMRTADFDFALPPELIAQSPAPKRDESRLLVLHRMDGRVEHRKFRDLLEFVRDGDVLVLNNSRVIPARLRGVNAKTAGKFEILLLEESAVNDWWAMLRPGKNARIGTQIVFHDTNGQSTEILATVTEVNGEGHRRLKFSGTPDIQPRIGLARRNSIAALHRARKTIAGGQRTLSNRFCQTRRLRRRADRRFAFYAGIIGTNSRARRKNLLRHFARRPRNFPAGES